MMYLKHHINNRVERVVTHKLFLYPVNSTLIGWRSFLKTISQILPQLVPYKNARYNPDHKHIHRIISLLVRHKSVRPRTLKIELLKYNLKYYLPNLPLWVPHRSTRYIRDHILHIHKPRVHHRRVRSRTLKI